MNHPTQYSSYYPQETTQLPLSLLTTARRLPILFIHNSKHRLRLRRRRETAPRPNLRPVPPKHDGYGHKEEGDAAEERAGPVDAERVEHVGGE